jgi:hypothetical protein
MCGPLAALESYIKIGLLRPCLVCVRVCVYVCVCVCVCVHVRCELLVCC